MRPGADRSVVNGPLNEAARHDACYMGKLQFAVFGGKKAMSPSGDDPNSYGRTLVFNRHDDLDLGASFAGVKLPRKRLCSIRLMRNYRNERRSWKSRRIHHRSVPSRPGYGHNVGNFGACSFAVNIHNDP